MKEETLVEKWKCILDYTSQLVTPLDKDKYEYVASRLEEFEILFKNYPNFLKRFIPQIRSLEGLMEYTFEMIDGNIAVVFYGNHDGTITQIAVLFEPFQTFRCQAMKDYFIRDKDNNWTLV